mmetsp:Transcript_64544/g.138381  ORF Transcript_64544/g.138381 Transcript_64544/m.138381 type:complete len:276 (-) Transcript_64544:72-899(-)
MYTPLGYRSKAGWFQEDLKTWLEKRKGLFPGYLTLWEFAIFGSPIISAIRLWLDPSVRFWIGWHSAVILAVPICLVMAHVIHVFLGRPSFAVMLLCTVFPSILVVVIGFWHSVPLGGVADRLDSLDCFTYEDKRYMENAYLAAVPIYENCTARKAAAHNTTVQDVQRHLLLTNCEEYTAIMAEGTGPYVSQWAYLEKIVDTEECSGWCTKVDHPLWTHARADDMVPCTAAASSVLRSKARRIANRMFVTGLLDLFISTVVLMAVQEWLLKRGISW